jgi:predicted nucleic acid-binding protein
MTDKLLLDSNIIIYLQKGELTLDDIPDKYQQFCVSVINYLEVVGFPFESEEEKNAIENFFVGIEIIQLDGEIINKTIELKQQRKRKLLDTIIASTAIVQNVTLATRNTEDFENIPDLKIFNPFDK